MSHTESDLLLPQAYCPNTPVTSYTHSSEKVMMSAEPKWRQLARHYDHLAFRYDQAMDHLEQWLLGDWRAWAAAQARGRTLEIAFGTGRTLPYYSHDITLIGLDISSGMLARAQLRRPPGSRRTLPIRADAQSFPIGDQQLDVVISVLSLCTIPNYRRALAESFRVLVPGGRLVLVEHVRSSHRFLSLLQHLFNPISVRFAHDHLTREPLDLLEPLGFRVLDVARRRAGIVERILAEKPF